MRITQPDQPDLRHAGRGPWRRWCRGGVPGGPIGCRQSPKRRVQIELQPIRLHAWDFDAAGDQGEQRNTRGQPWRHQARRGAARRAQRHIAQFKLGDQPKRQAHPANTGAISGGVFDLCLDARREAA